MGVKAVVVLVILRCSLYGEMKRCRNEKDKTRGTYCAVFTQTTARTRYDGLSHPTKSTPKPRSLPP